MAVKMTFSLDESTAAELGRTAQRLQIPKSRVVREAIHEFAARAGRLSERERRHLLQVFDDLVPQIPPRDVSDVEAELAEIRRARRTGGRAGRPGADRPES